jgi:hypothetical protein
VNWTTKGNPGAGTEDQQGTVRVTVKEPYWMGGRVLPNERIGPEEIFWHPFGVRSFFRIHRGSSLRFDPRLLSFNPPG